MIGKPEEWKNDYEKARMLLLDIEQLHLKANHSAQHALQIRLLSGRLDSLLVKLENSNILGSNRDMIVELRNRFERTKQHSADQTLLVKKDNSHTSTAQNTVNYEKQIKIQDQQLEELSKLVSKTKEMSQTIHKELESQNKLLDHTNEAMDTTKSTISSVTRQTKKIIKK